MSTYLINPTAEQEEVVRCFLEEQHIYYTKEEEETLPDFVIEGIAKSMEDYEAGRVHTFDEFKARLQKIK